MFVSDVCLKKSPQKCTASRQNGEKNEIHAVLRYVLQEGFALRSAVIVHVMLV